MVRVAQGAFEKSFLQARLDCRMIFQTGFMPDRYKCKCVLRLFCGTEQLQILAGIKMSTTEKGKQEIDFVITWVDGSDDRWQKEKQETRKHLGIVADVDDRKERYRDWDNLQYWFRGVEKYAPWVRKIHFVTWGHLPKWLNTDHPKLRVVNHEDFIPQEYRPTFNSHTIEWNLHRIPDLAEQFVYFNDDTFLLRPVSEEDFFRKGKPVDMLALQPDVANIDNTVMSYIYLNNTMVLAKYFDKYSNIKKQPGAYFHIGYPPMHFFYNMLELAFPRFTGFYTVHGPSPLLKDTYRKLWDMEPELLDPGYAPIHFAIKMM